MKIKNGNIFEIILFLIVCSFAFLYLILNYNKIEFVNKFNEESNAVDANNKLIIKDNDFVILDKTIPNTPIQTIENKNVYFYDFSISNYDLTKKTIEIEESGTTLKDYSLYRYNDSIILKDKNSSIHVFILNNYINNLSHMIPLFDRKNSIDLKPEQSEWVYNNENFYDIKYTEHDGEYTEQRINLNISFEKDQIYVLRVEYATKENGNPFFITIDDNIPGYYPIHQQLDKNMDNYKLVNMMLIPDKRMPNPSLLLRNSGGKGTVVFKNIRIYKLKSEKMND